MVIEVSISNKADVLDGASPPVRTKVDLVEGREIPNPLDLPSIPQQKATT